ncbi:MAG: hypothetical protein ACT4O1_10310 [Gemmatimonadota bacterium]
MKCSSIVRGRPPRAGNDDDDEMPPDGAVRMAVSTGARGSLLQRLKDLLVLNWPQKIVARAQLQEVIAETLDTPNATTASTRLPVNAR